MGPPKLFAWNCQRFGSLQTKRALKHHLWRDHLNVVFLLETKKEDKVVDVRRQSFGFDSAAYVLLVGRSGGLALWWKNEVKLSVLTSNPHFIHVCFEDSTPWFVTFVYGHPRTENRKMV